MSESPQIVAIPVEQIRKNPWNPNVMSESDFNELCRSMDESGMVEPILVRPVEHVDGVPCAYEVINGEHRWQALRIRGEVTVPAIVVEWDDEKAMAETFRLNALRGHIDLEKFMQLWNQLVATRGEEVARQMLALTDQVKFEQFVKRVRAELPKEMRPKFDEVRKGIRTMSDLATVLNKLFAEYGDSVPLSYMFFTYGGQMHLMVQMDGSLRKVIDGVTYVCTTGKHDIGEVLVEMLSCAESQLTLAKRMTKVDSGAAEAVQEGSV